NCDGPTGKRIARPVSSRTSASPSIPLPPVTRMRRRGASLLARLPRHVLRPRERHLDALAERAPIPREDLHEPLLDADARTVPEHLLCLRDLGEAVADVARARVDVGRLDLALEELPEDVQEARHRDAVARP